MDYRQEAIEKLKENGISMVSMEVYIQGYIDGRNKSIDEVKDKVYSANKELEVLLGENNV